MSELIPISNLTDYRSGSTRFCSSLIVNAIMALGSRFTDGIEVRGDALDGSTAGDVFYHEALRLLGSGKTCMSGSPRAMFHS